MPKIIPPCKDCNGRYLSCHKECDLYTEFRKQSEKQKEDIAKANVYENYKQRRLKRNN